MFIDPVAIGAIFYGVLANEPGAAVSGALVHILNGPLIHLLNLQLGSAGWSLLARLTTVPATFLLLPNLPSRFMCKTPIACRNLFLGVAGVGLVVGWLHDALGAEKPPLPRTGLWSANLSMGLSQDGTPTWGVTLSH